MRCFLSRFFFAKGVRISLLLIFCLIFSIALSGYESGKEIPVVKSPSTNKAIYKIGMSKIDITPDVEFDRVNMHCYFDRRNKTSTGVQSCCN